MEAVKGGADIVDVKNPEEGALGANFPWVIKRVKEITPNPTEVSCTLGDLPNLPGSMSLAAFGAASIGVDYVKCSLCGVNTPEDAIYLLKNVVKAAKEAKSSIKVVAAGFADADRVGSINPLYIPQVTWEAGADVAMLDTAVKDGKSLLYFLKPNQLKTFVIESQNFGLKTALAGSLRKEDLPKICTLSADIVGLRGAACTNFDRAKGQIVSGKVSELAQIIRKTTNGVAKPI